MDILYDFKGIKIPLDLLVSYVGWLKPREYSIASSHKKEPSTVRLLVALVEYKTIQGSKHGVQPGQIEGICSRHFKASHVGSDVFFSLKEGTLAFPKDSKVPFMVVGPGTGIAPFISFLEEREVLAQEQGVPMSRHKHFVFFGCRNKEKDWLHREIMTRMQKEEK